MTTGTALGCSPAIPLHFRRKFPAIPLPVSPPALGLGLTRGPAEPIPGVELCPAGDIGPQTAWLEHLASVETVIHLATRAHRPASAITPQREAESAAAFRSIGLRQTPVVKGGEGTRFRKR